MSIRLVKLYVLWIDGIFHVLNDLFDGNVEEVILPFVAEFRSRVHAAFANF
jgi:hypothetical protein